MKMNITHRNVTFQIAEVPNGFTVTYGPGHITNWHYISSALVFIEHVSTQGTPNFSAQRES